MRKLLTALVLSITAAGCGPVYHFTKTTQETAVAKPEASCDFLVTASAPDPQSYVELGVLEWRRVPPHRIDEFKSWIFDDVCAAGGDLVVGEINGAGVYVRGIVFKKRAVAAN
jgi:hypothetical protein